MAEDCIFCKIVAGEIPAQIVDQDEHTLAFMDLMPQTEGHALVITREPAETLFDLSPEGAAACIRTTQRVAAAVKRAFDAPGIMVTQVNGAAAGQTVPHVHFHIIPRRPGEQLLMHAAVKADPEVLRQQAERIRRWL